MAAASAGGPNDARQNTEAAQAYVGAINEYVAMIYASSSLADLLHRGTRGLSVRYWDGWRRKLGPIPSYGNRLDGGANRVIEGAVPELGWQLDTKY